MSLFDYLNNDGTSTSSLSAQVQMLVQQAQAKLTGTATASTDAGGTNTNDLSTAFITMDAQRASAEATDAKKDAAKLAVELRATLDEDGNGSMGAFSGRGLSLIALNEDGSFSRAEVAAAKAELRERDRASVLAFFNSGALTAASLKAYGQQLIAGRQSMSAEEQQLRASDPNLR